MTFLPVNSKAPYLPTSQIYPEDYGQLIRVLTETYTQIASRVNARSIGVYQDVENITGNSYFNAADPLNPINSYRKIFVIGAIATGATLTFAHNISGFSTLTFVQSHCEVITDAATFNKRSVPYASATLVTDQIQIDKDDTNVRLINGATAPNITSGILILEYLKS